MRRRGRKLNNKGFSLVEVLVAMVILAIISVPILSSFSRAAKVNAKARRQENANVAASSVVEQFKSSSLNELKETFNGNYSVNNGVYNFNIYNSVGEGGTSNSYTGINGEKFRVEATLEPSLYTAGSDDDKNYNNNINSYVNSIKNFVLRDELYQCDTEAEQQLRAMVGATAYDKKQVVKTTNINIDVKRNESSQNKGTGDGIDDYYQSVSVHMEYKYGNNDLYIYKKDVEFPNNYFKAASIGSNSYRISSALDSNLKDVYIFYTPFDTYSKTTVEGGTLKFYSNDILNINYNYGNNETYMNYDNCNVFIIQQTVVNDEYTDYKMQLNRSNVKLTINGQAKQLATEGTVSLSKTKGTSGPVSIFANIYKWNTYVDPDNAGGGNNGITSQSLLYSLTVKVYYKDEAEPIAEIVTTKVG